MEERAIRDFWFEGVDAQGEPDGDAVSRWFRGDEALDQTLSERFGDSVQAALAGELVAWAETPTGRLSLVLLLDQLPRNLFRGSARSFSGDAAALALTRAALAAGEDRELSPVERYFLYMPLEHAEDLAAQDESVARFRALAESRGPDVSAFYRGGIDWAERHRNAIAELGRFPARNEALGREPTPEEAVFLKRHPSGF